MALCSPHTALSSLASSCGSQALSHPLGLLRGRQHSGRRRRAAREDVCQVTYVLKQSPFLLLPLFLLKFVQDCYKGRRHYQGVSVSHTSTLPEAPGVAGLFNAQITLLVHWELREEGQPASQRLFLQGCEEAHWKAREGLAGVTLLSI